MISITDQAGNIIRLPASAKRIISLVPSQTELLYDLGLSQEVIGITKFCVHPNAWFKAKTRVGGTKTANIQKIISLQPDLIIANKEENVKEQIEELEKFVPVYVSNIVTIANALQMIVDVGKLTGKKANAEEIANTIKASFEELRSINDQYSKSNFQRTHLSQSANLRYNFSTPPPSQLRTAYLIWKDPYMAAGGDTFINEMLRLCGLKNIFENEYRYPQIEISQLSSADCQLLMLSSEPYPFKQKHIDELQQYLPGTKILLVDGEMFSWYGSRLLHSAKYLKQLLLGLG